jgi:hypothetical protein
VLGLALLVASFALPALELPDFDPSDGRNPKPVRGHELFTYSVFLPVFWPAVVATTLLWIYLALDVATGRRHRGGMAVGGFGAWIALASGAVATTDFQGLLVGYWVWVGGYVALLAAGFLWILRPERPVARRRRAAPSRLDGGL